MPLAIEPGSRFDVEYKPGCKLSAIAINLRQKIALMEKMEIVTSDDSKGTDKLQAIIDALKILFPDITESEVDSFDEEMAMEAIKTAMSKNRVSEEQEKK